MIVSAALLLLILTPIFGSMIFSLPIVQNKIVQVATEFASEHLQTEVRIGRIDITMSGRIEVSDFLVRDLDFDTLLYVKHLDSRLLGFSATKSNIKLGSSTIDGVKFNLRQTDRGEMNIREIILKISSKPGGGKLSIDVASVDLTKMDMTIKQLTQLNPEYGVDMRDIRLNNISGRVEELFIDGPALHAHIKSFSAEERSGFQLQNLVGELYLTQGALAISDMNLTTHWSSLTMPHLMLVGRKWTEYRDFNTATHVSVEISDGFISSDDLAYFAPQMKNYGVVLYDLDLSINGEVEDLVAEINNISYGDSTFISARAELFGLPVFDDLHSLLNIGGVTTSYEDISLLHASVTGRELPEQSARMIESLGRTTLRGVVHGDRGTRELDVEASLESEIGEVSSSITLLLEPSRTEVTLNGEVRAKSLDVGQLLSDKRLGTVSFTSQIDGEVGATSSFTSESYISQIVLNGYNLRNISLKGDLDGEKRSIASELKVDDANLKLSIHGSGSGFEIGKSDMMTGSMRPNFTMGVDLQHANLKSLGLNQRDTTSTLSAKIDIIGEGRSVEDASLNVKLLEGQYLYNSHEILTGGAKLLLDSRHQDRSVELTSDFVDLSFYSTSRVADISNYLRGVLAEYLPALYRDPESILSKYRSLSTHLDGESFMQDMSLDPISRLTIKTHNLMPITQAMAAGLEVGDDSSLELTFDDKTRIFDLNLHSNFFERRALLAIGLNAHLTNRGDSLSMTSRLGELYVGTSHIVGSEILAGAKSNRIALESSFTNQTDSLSADIKSRLLLHRDRAGRPELNVELLPSIVTRRDRVWSLGSQSIDINHRGVKIDNFTAASTGQLLTLNGYASQSLADTLTMQMSNFDLSIFSSFISKVGYNIEGRTNGAVVASSVLKDARLEAEVMLDSVSINSIVTPPMSMDMTWDTPRNRASLTLTNRQTKESMVKGYYMPSQVRYYARYRVDSVNMALLDPPLGGVITDTKGYAHLDLTLQGRRREAKLSGVIDVENFETTVDYTGVRYSMPRAQIEVSNNRLLCRDAEIKDGKGGGGTAELDVNLQHLSNIGYTLRLLPKRLMVLNTTERDNELFYGDLYASGLVQISGDKSGVRMNVTASTDGESRFFMPLSNKESVSTADFITFVQPTVVDTLDALSSRRRSFERRSSGSGGSIVINMSLDVNTDTEVQLVIDPTVGDVIRARGEGQLNLSLEPSVNKFEIYGDYTINEGSYLFTLQNIVNKRFVIDPGSSIQWSGSPLDANLNIGAIYKLKTSLQPILSDESTRAVPVDCIIKLTDRLTQPEVEFSIELPSSDAETQTMFNNLLNDQEAISRQFFYLMLANSFMSDGSAGGTSDLGASAGASTGFELLTNQLSNWLSTSSYSVIIRYRPESELTGEELDVGFSRGLINNRLLVELEGNFVTDSSSTMSEEDTSNFMGEAYLTWLIDRSGALRLKGFTQTIDRFDENQGLQETGVGIYYRESFDNFADLRERVKARFSASNMRIEERERRKREKTRKQEKGEKKKKKKEEESARKRRDEQEDQPQEEQEQLSDATDIIVDERRRSKRERS